MSGVIRYPDHALRPAVVYRHFSADGALLYVGSTISLPEREMYHRGDSPWYVDGLTTTARIFGCLDLAREGEVEAIQTEYPRWNILHRAKDHPDGWVRTHWEVGQMYPGTFQPHKLQRPPDEWYLKYKRRVAA